MTTEMELEKQQEIDELKEEVKRLKDRIEAIENALHSISSAADMRSPKIDRNQLSLRGWQIKGTLPPNRWD